MRIPLKCRCDRSGHFLDGSHAVDGAEQTCGGVIADQRSSLFAISVKPLGEYLGVVVWTDLFPACRHLGDALLNALEEDTLIDLEFDHGIERKPLLGQHAVERLGLGHRSRESVKDEAAGG